MSGPSNFSSFLNSVRAVPNFGKAFEKVAKWHLENDPAWSAFVERVWLWEDWPGSTGPDCGIDLIYEAKDGKIWAVQVKCYAEDRSVTKSDIDTFLSESNTPAIDGRILMATTDLLSQNARRTCMQQEKPVRLYMRHSFEQSALQYPATYEEYLAGLFDSQAPVQTSGLLTPRPYQRDAIEDVAEGLSRVDRGQLIMACGTGKTLTTLWIKESLGAQNTLVLVPSINLLGQTLREWTRVAKDGFSALCICSDASVANASSEDIGLMDLEFPVSTKLEDIEAFLQKRGNRVVFSTYHSSPLISEAQADGLLPDFDLVIADEAHRCAGKVKSAFGAVLDGARIRATKRLFTTATPRVYSTSLRKKAEDRGIDYVGMDDEELFGPVFHRLSFGKAIRDRLLTDYQVVVVGVDRPAVADLIRRNELVETAGGITDAQSLAAKIGLVKAVNAYKLRKVISFHSRVRGAEEFARDYIIAAGQLPATDHSIGRFWAEPVSGKMPAYRRHSRLKALGEVPPHTSGLLTNARCLSEGIDVPSLDGIAFIDPRTSQIDIIQAVGRAIRLSKTKTIGTIVLPVFIEDGDDVEEQLAASQFDTVWAVLRALRSHDETLAEELDQHRVEYGRTGKSELPSRIIIDLPGEIPADFASSLKALLLRASTAPWDHYFGLLKAFYELHGHLRISAKFIDPTGLPLGKWCGQQRWEFKNKRLGHERRARLEQIGFVFDEIELRWQENYRMLADFVASHGNADVPRNEEGWDGVNLHYWAARQRKYYRNGLLTPEKITMLERLGFIWDAEAEAWESGFQHLQQFFDQHGHSNVQQPFHTASGFHLGNWVQQQRRRYRLGRLGSERVQRLSQINFVWDEDDRRWQDGYRRLSKYFRRFGNIDVPKSYDDGLRPNLLEWIRKQREKWRTGKLRAEHKSLLDQLGFIYDPLNDNWSQAYKALKSFVASEGHCRVHPKFKTKEGFALGNFIQIQRRKHKDGGLKPDEYAALNELGFIWDVGEEQWESRFEELRNFVAANGHAIVPKQLLGVDKSFYEWASRQRKLYRQCKLSSDRIHRLNELGFVWDLDGYRWEQGFENLRRFQKENSHVLVPYNFRCADGTVLDRWLKRQVNRANKGRITREQIEKLKSIGVKV